MEEGDLDLPADLVSTSPCGDVQDLFGQLEIKCMLSVMVSTFT